MSPTAQPNLLAPVSATDGIAASAVLNIVLGTTPAATVTDSNKKLIEILAKQMPGTLQLRLGDNYCVVSLEESGKQKSLQSVRGFYLAQFQTAFGSQMPVSKQQLTREPAHKSLAELFDLADRNLDGNLSLPELKEFLDLIEQGVTCQTLATVGTHGRNLFEALDADHDSRLTRAELNSAASRLLSGQMPIATSSTVSREQIPIRYQLHLGRGTPGNAFGPIPIPKRAKRPTEPASPVAASGPRWFELIDRNSDGFLSPREFLGTPQLFLRLDTNSDGLISIQESQTAIQAMPPPAK